MLRESDQEYLGIVFTSSEKDEDNGYCAVLEVGSLLAWLSVPEFLSRAQLVILLKSQGYVQIRTAGGWLDLEKWWPYGQAGKNVMFYMGDDGRVHEEHNQTRPIAPWIKGVWEVRKEKGEERDEV